MTYGHWLKRAHDHLERARLAQRQTRAISGDDLAAAINARQHVYQGLSRLIFLIEHTPPRPINVDQQTANIAMQPAAGTAMDLLIGAAAATHIPFPLWRNAPVTSVGQQMAEAAAAIATAGDILASHASCNGQVSSPEGAAIQAGAGRIAAIGDVARLMCDQMLVDAGTPTWIAASAADVNLHATLYAPAIAACRWTVTGPLRHVAHAAIATGNQHPNLIHRLGPATSLRQDRRGRPGSTAEAVERLAALRTWLFRHPEQVRPAHLAAGTRLGLVISAAPSPGSRGASTGAWAQAAAAARLAGSPPSGPGLDALAEMKQLIEWTRDRVTRRADASDRVPESARHLVSQLPGLAELLGQATDVMVDRGDAFVQEPRVWTAATAGWFSMPLLAGRSPAGSINRSLTCDSRCCGRRRAPTAWPDRTARRGSATSASPTCRSPPRHVGTGTRR